MRTEFEFRSFMSRKELRQALALTAEAAERLSSRMTAADLAAIEAHGLALAALAAEARRRLLSTTPAAVMPPAAPDWQPAPRLTTRSASITPQ